MMRLAYTVLASIFAVLFNYSFADPRLEVNSTGGLVHFPISFEDAGNEVFVSDAKPHIYVQDGVANGNAEWSHRGLRTVHPYAEGSTTWNQNNTDFVCNMVDSNGTTYTATIFEAGVTVTPHTDYTDNLYFGIRCFNGTSD